MIKYADEKNIRETVFGFRIIVLGVVPFIMVHMAEAKKNLWQDQETGFPQNRLIHI